MGKRQFNPPSYIVHIQICIVIILVSTCVAPGNTATTDSSVMDTIQTDDPNPQSTVINITLNTSDTFYYQRIRYTLAKRFHVRYNFTFKKDACCPVIYFTAQTPNPPYNSTHVDHRCFVGGQSFINVATFTTLFVYMKVGNTGSGCALHGENVVCTGTRSFLFSMKRTWYFALGYQCESQKPLRIGLNMVFDFDQPLTCMPMAYEQCSGQFNYTQFTLPNVAGQATELEAARLFRTISLLFAKDNCYQHGMEMACKSLFTECRDHDIYRPCLQGCTDFITGCHDALKKWDQDIRCGNFPPSLDPKVCWYKPITCLVPSPIEFGTVSVTGYNLSSLATYTCDDGYTLVGAPVSICMYSGEWNSSSPVCQKGEALTESYDSSKLLLGLGFVVILLIGIIIGICIRFRNNMTLIIFHNNYISEKRNANLPEEKKKVFLTYSSLDSQDIEANILPEMKTHLPSWNVITFERDFLPGRPLLDTINESIWESQAVIVLLTENYIQSAWCEYEFAEAQTRSAKDKSFRLIIILHQKEGKETPMDLDKLPEQLRSFVQSRIYLTINERLFWNKLRRGLTE